MSLESKLRDLINCESREDVSDTQDIVLAEFMCSCLHAFERATIRRAELSQNSESKVEQRADNSAKPKCPNRNCGSSDVYKQKEGGWWCADCEEVWGTSA